MAAQCLSSASAIPSNSRACVRNLAGSSCSLRGSRKPLVLGSSFRGAKLAVERPRPDRSFVRKRHSTVATVLFSLPTANPERASPEKLPKWSARAIKSFAMAELEARKLKYPNTGTEALVMGILVEGTSLAAKFLRANGITLFKVREEIVNLLGKSDMYFFSPEHPPLTEPAQRALDWAVDTKLKSGEDGEITPSHILLGVWSEKESAGHKILESMGFTDEKAEELAKSVSSKFQLEHCWADFTIQSSAISFLFQMDKDVKLSYK